MKLAFNFIQGFVKGAIFVLYWDLYCNICRLQTGPKDIGETALSQFDHWDLLKCRSFIQRLSQLMHRYCMYKKQTARNPKEGKHSKTLINSKAFKKLKSHKINVIISCTLQHRQVCLQPYSRPSWQAHYSFQSFLQPQTHAWPWSSRSMHML